MKPGSTKHHEEDKSTQISFAKDVKSLISVIDVMGNPFTDESGDLLVLDTKDLADTSVVKRVEEVETLRREQFETFVKERLSEKKTKNMHDSTKKNKLPLFRSPRQKEPSKDKQQISSLKSDCALFSRLFFSGQTREKDLDEFFEHENQGCPPSQSGQLRLPRKKSDLTGCIQSLSQPRSSAPTPINAAIIDGAAAINMLKPTNTVKTFQECRHHMGQEPMTRSLQLPYWANVTAFLQTDLFLDYLCRKKQRQFRFGDPMTSG